MVRPRLHDDKKVVEVARRIFLEQGPGASTLTIAKEAGVSEGLLFKRFGTKQKLFLTALRIPELIAEELFKDRVGAGEVRDNLMRAATLMINHFEKALPTLLTIWSEKNISFIRQLHKQSPSLPDKLLETVAKYLSAEKELGRIGDIDTLVTARLLMASTSNYILWKIAGIALESETSVEEYIRGIVDVLWRGLKPK